MGGFSAVLALACLAVAALHLVRLAGPGRALGDVPGGPAGELSHATMGLGTAAMFAPLLDPVPAAVWTVAFLACGAWFAAVALRAGSFAGDAGHHVVGSATMLFMLLTGPGGDAVDGPAAAGHAHHAGGGGSLGWVSLVAIVLAGYFAWHVLRCSDRLRVSHPRDPGPGPTAGGTAVATRPVGLLRSTRTAAWAHVVMAVAMTVMLLAMV
ncbi:MAG TPA: DUF5134 domain-containing protein [Pseudonocardia sp.]|nr:DUF5134 domain-containing protein [Pseudonocardia sp.]